MQETAAEGERKIATTNAVPSRVIALDGCILRDEARDVAVETPVQILFADVPFAVMMLTPSDLDDFAYGFSLTEGVIDRADEIRGVTIEQAADGFRLTVRLVGEKLHKHLARQRAMTGRTGCGICGIEDFDALRRAPIIGGEGQAVTIEAVSRALVDLDARQPLNNATRAVHGAAWADLSGNILEVREDVGRHNALDKLIGALLKLGTDPAAGFFVITSRCSFEMVEKAATFGSRILVAISAPTSLAIERAHKLDLTLIGIARRDTFTAFANTKRLVTKGF